MPANYTSEDLRSQKTEKALYAAIFSLLKKSSFRKITIKGICEEAYISRAAFYAHFIDKYDLLKRWIAMLWPQELINNESYDQIEKAVNTHVQENMAIYKNLVYDADNETFMVLYKFLISTLQPDAESSTGALNSKDAVLANFYAGGMISYLLWQIKHKFPADVPLMNRHIFDMLRMIRTWRPELDENGKSGGYY